MNTVVPSHTKVVVIGGGVVGVGAALALADMGVPTVLCEKGAVAGEQSSRNWGWIRKQGRAAAELPLMIQSERLWQRYAAEVGEDIGFRQGGVTYLARDADELAERAAFLAVARDHQLDTRLLDRAAVAAMTGGATAFCGGVHTPSDHYAEPTLAVPALARLAARRGVIIAERTAVRSLVRTAGRVSSVVTEHGSIACGAVILAGGVWSRTFLENAGLAFPQLGVQSSVLATNRLLQPSPSTLGTGPASIRPRADGGYTVARTGAARFDLIPAAFAHLPAFMPTLKANWRIMKLRAGPAFFGPLGRRRWDADEASPFEAVRTMDPPPDSALLADVLESARKLYPALKDAHAVRTWGGMIDVMPDELPVIDALDAPAGLTVATGFSGHGFGLGLGAGLLAAQLATARTPLVDPAPFRMARFSSGVRPSDARPIDHKHAA